MSYFAAQGFSKAQCTEALKVFKGIENPCLSILWKTFDRPGKANCAQKFLFENRAKPHTLQIHFDDSTYRRRKEFYFGAIAPEYKTQEYNRELRNRDEYVLRLVRERAVEIMEFKRDYGFDTTELILSTGLEDDYSTAAFRAVYEEIKKNITPDVLLARNPNGTKESGIDIAGADFIELHSTKPKFRESSGARCITSLDGYGLELSNHNRRGSKPGVLSMPEVLAFIRRSRARNCRVFLWEPESQGRGQGEFMEPRRRNFRIRSENVRLINKIIRRFDNE